MIDAESIRYRGTVLAIALALLALGAFCTPAHAYVLEGVRWPSGSVVTFQFGLGSPGRTLIDGNTSWNVAAAPAATAWSDVVANLQLATNFVTQTSAVSGDGVNSIVFANTMFGDSFGSRTLAVTYYNSYGSTISEADVLFNKNQTFDSYRGPLRYSGGYAIGDIRRVLIHELGHAIGLDHPDEHGQHVDAIMNSVTSNRETLSADDIAGAQAMYGAPAAAVKSDFSADYLLANASTGETILWHLRADVFLDAVSGPTLPPGWTVACIADVNRDGSSDYILWNGNQRQTAVWYLNGNVYARGGFGPSIPSGWALVAMVDIDGDGHPDYVLQHLTTGQTAVWFLNGTTYIHGAWGPTLPAGWTLADVADFNADGKPDFVLVSPASRQTAIWYMDKTQFSSGTYGPSLSPGWMLQGTADFNNDGKPDYILLNASTHQTAQWYLNGVVRIGSAYAPSVPAGYNLICR